MTDTNTDALEAKIAEAEHRARQVIGEDPYTAPRKLWHPWALDLADDVLLLLAARARLADQLEAKLAAAENVIEAARKAEHYLGNVPALNVPEYDLWRDLRKFLAAYDEARRDAAAREPGNT